MRPPPHVAASTSPALHAGSSRRRPHHRGRTMMSVSCCHLAALVSILAAGAATALLTLSLPSSPGASTTRRTDFAGALSVANETPPLPHLSAPPAPATPPPAPPSPPADRPRKREPSFWRMAPEEALRYAKKEIRDAEPVLDDPDLYAPLFKNVSQFKSLHLPGRPEAHLPHASPQRHLRLRGLVHEAPQGEPPARRRRRGQGAPLLPSLQLSAAEAHALRGRLPQPQAAGRVPEKLRQRPRQQVPVLEPHERSRPFPCRLP
uniref:Uncharacterized protein n=1 Tax=Zea mays TaxID=4577 RepID=A0A804NGB1_MAIZE